jgi:hypothetical protein
MILSIDRRTVQAIRLLIAGVLSCGCAGASRHTEQTDPGMTAGAESASATDPIVCRKQDVPGHRMPKRVCRHQSEIDAERTSARTLMQQAQQPGSAQPEAGKQQMR